MEEIESKLARYYPLKQEKTEKKEKIQKLEVEIKKLKNDMKVVIIKLLSHYYDLLKTGRDTRYINYNNENISFLLLGRKASHG